MSERPPRNPFYPKELFNLDEGPCTFDYPDELNRESVAELEDWLALILRRLKRRVRRIKR